MLEGVWHFPVFDDYGTHEIRPAAFRYQEKDGLHLMEDMFIIEVADVDTD
jgi:phenylacetate-CoA ligase